jgi:hypothetical protein
LSCQLGDEQCHLWPAALYMCGPGEA